MGAVTHVDINVEGSTGDVCKTVVPKTWSPTSIVNISVFGF